MADRGEILQMLRTERECVCRDCDRECGRCDLAQDRCWLLDMYDGAIDLLTPVAPKVNELVVSQYGYSTREEYMCGSCGCGLTTNEKWRTKFCPECGREVRWG